MATGDCAQTAFIGKAVLGLGFETCLADCLGASLTDAMLTAPP